MTTRSDEPWRLQGRCADDPYSGLWDCEPGPVGSRRRESEKTKLAKSLCSPCPVRLQCLDGAVRDGDVWTVRGGMTPDERFQADLHPDWWARRTDMKRKPPLKVASAEPLMRPSSP